MANGGDVRLIFVYGTLKRGFYNHKGLMDTGDVTYLGPHTTVDAYPLVCGPHGIPYLINLHKSGHCIKGELYSVSASALDRLDDLEGVGRGHYERLQLSVKADGCDDAVINDAEAYFAHRGFGEALWKRCGEEGFPEYNVDMGNNYVRREDRPSHSTFLLDIQNFISFHFDD